MSFVKKKYTKPTLISSLSSLDDLDIPRRPWGERDCEANAGQLLCKKKNKQGQFAAESLENDRNLENSKILWLKLYQ